MKKKCDEGSFNLSKSKKNVRPYGKVRKDNKNLVRNEYEAKDRNDIAGACAACALRCESYAVALNVDYARLENLTFSLELNASASNSLSIAVGTAAGDALTLDEADFEWGYDCGKWFRADTATGNVDEWPELGNGRRGLGDIEIGLSYSRAYTKFTIRIR